jgi:hypothetical protein
MQFYERNHVVGEIKDLCARIKYPPQIHTFFSIIIMDPHISCEAIVTREWNFT